MSAFSSSTGSTSSAPAFRRVMRYLWDPERKNTDHEHDIVVLGRRYDPKVTAVCCTAKTDIDYNNNNNNNNNEGVDESNTAADGYSTHWPAEFLDDVNSRVWMTYRTGFKLIPRAKNGPSTISLGGILRGSGIDLAGFTTDSGWGCMIRTGQSLLANALLLLKLGRDWRHPMAMESEAEIIKWFADDPNAQFSVHRFVEHGETYCGKMPGEWFGPSAAASSIKALCESTKVLNVYVGDGSDVYENNVQRAMQNPDGTSNPVLILLAIRLGIDQVNPVYWDALKNLLALPQAVGIAGGRPSSSHYFYGFQNNDLFYLDPHLQRPLLKQEELPQALDSVHTTRIRMLNMDEMDPSMLVGFLVCDEDDWADWKERIRVNNEPRPIINVSAREPVITCGSSISVGSDRDETEFIDVGFDAPPDPDPDFNTASTTSIESEEEVINKAEATTTTSSSAEYDTVVIEASQMLSGSTNSSYVEPSYLDTVNQSSAIDDEEWEVMK